MLCWIDFETTGLDPNLDHPLEIAVVLTADRLEIMAKRSYLIKPPNTNYFTTMVPRVVEMHEKNNLIEDVMDRGMPVETVQADLIKWCLQQAPEEILKQTPICGSSVLFDRRVAMRWMPVWEDLWSYRCIDCSTMKEVAKRWAPAIDAWKSPETKPHRAALDVLASIDEARHYRDTFFEWDGVTRRGDRG